MRHHHGFFAVFERVFSFFFLSEVLRSAGARLFGTCSCSIVCRVEMLLLLLLLPHSINCVYCKRQHTVSQRGVYRVVFFGAERNFGQERCCVLELLAGGLVVVLEVVACMHR